MPLTVRVQGASGLKRIELLSVSSPWSELLGKVASRFALDPRQQRLSRTRLHKPEFIDAAPETPVGAIGIEHGTMLFLKEPEVSEPQTKSAFKLSAKCQHNAKGRCINCLGAASSDAPLAAWLCTHPPSAFCPKCLPPPPPDESLGKAEESGSKRQSVAAASYHVDVIPYRQMMDEKKALCRYKHSRSTICHLCAPPSRVEFVGRPNCTSGHRRWPHGICGRCAPPNAVLHLQTYRHCDGISFKDVAAGERFISAWTSNPALQRAALLFGRYIDEPTESKNSGAIRAEVEALYVPPQTAQADGVKFLRDPSEKTVLAIASALGLSCVGWAITTLPRGGAEYGGDVFMSGREVRQAARFQNKFADELGHSRFVSLVVQHNDQGHIEPRAYQISDQGVAMERDGLLSDGSKAGFVQPRKEKKGEFVPSIVYKSRSLAPGEDFLPDELLVKVISMQPFKPKPMFKFVHFPLDGNDNHFRGYLSQHASEPYHVKFADFLALIYLAKKVGVELASEVALGVKESRALSDATQAKLDRALLAYM